LPVVRKSLAVKGEPVTNVKPLPKRVAERLYREREDDEASIRSFIQAQPVSSEE
jgi:hypothetical protein